MKTMGFYNTRYYDYKNDSLKNLPMEMSEKDREIFFCDFKTVSIFELWSGFFPLSQVFLTPRAHAAANSWI